MSVKEQVEAAFDYRGDVTLRLQDGRVVEGYVFDRNWEKGVVRVLKDKQKIAVAYGEIAEIQLTGRDTAAGKRWEDWVKNYHERRAAGEKNIQLVPEELD